MKRDNLEKFVQENRTKFDDASPNPMLWLEIEKEIGSQKKTKFRTLLRTTSIAASVVLLLGLGFWWGKGYDSTTDSDMSLVEQEAYQEFLEAEPFFQSQIDEKMKQVDVIYLPDDTKADLEQLDEVYLELKADLENSPNADNSLIIDALIQTYRTKINVLERIQRKMSNDTDFENIKL